MSDINGTFQIIIPVVVGFLLGILAEPILEWFKQRRRRKQIARMLSSEVAAIKEYADKRVQFFERKLEVAKSEKHVKPEPHCIKIIDNDFPTSIFRACISELGILDPEQIAKINALYYLVDVAHRIKQKNIETSERFFSLMQSGAGRTPTDEENKLLDSIGESSLDDVSAYIEKLDRIKNEADSSLKLLKDITHEEPEKFDLGGGPIYDRIDVDLEKKSK